MLSLHAFLLILGETFKIAEEIILLALCTALKINEATLKSTGDERFKINVYVLCQGKLSFRAGVFKININT